VGLGRAKDLVLTGRMVDAEEALAMGLVNRVVEDAGVLDEALRVAAAVAAQGATAVTPGQDRLERPALPGRRQLRLESVARPSSSRAGRRPSA